MYIKNAQKNAWKLFIIAGIAVAYFDFLTYPIVALGIPLVLFICIMIKENATIKKITYESGCCTLFWFISYLGMWAGKWLVASLLTHTNVFNDANSAIKFRTNGQYSDLKISPLVAIGKNILSSVKGQKHLILLVGVFLSILLLIGFAKKICSIKFRPISLLLLVVGLYPFVWYCIVQNHSVIHSWMTYRDFSITMFAILVFIAMNIYYTDSSPLHFFE